MVTELPADKASNNLPDRSFECRSTKDMLPLDEIVGQERAVRALQMGLRIKEKGFNIFVSGMPGTGKKTAITNFIEELSQKKEVPPDWCYVNNLHDETRPNALSLPAGKGKKLKEMMEKFVEKVPSALRDAFTSKEYAERRTRTMKTIEDERREYTGRISKMTSEAGFQVQQSPIGMVLVPLVNGKPISPEEMGTLSPETRKEFEKAQDELQTKIQDVLRSLLEVEKKAEEASKKLNREVATYVMAPLLQPLREAFKDSDEVPQFLNEVTEDILDNLAPILRGNQEERPEGILFRLPAPDPMRKYGVNLIVDNSDLKGAPIIIEMNPSYYRFFGAAEKEARFGALVTDYTMIRAGSSHKANGGFLVVPAEGILLDPVMWWALKQTISNQVLEIEDKETRLGYMATRSLRPEPIPFDAKVIILGDPMVYDLLFNLDKDFRELFKVKAEFDTVMDRTSENIQKYGAFACGLSQKEGLLHLDPSGLAALIDYSSRLVEDQEKLSTRFAEISDILREANFYALEEGSEVISRKHIDRQREEKIHRSDLIQQKIEELISRGVFLIDIDGEKVGQVNGLAVLSTGDYAFGRPNRITATVGVGRGGITDIERIAQMGGPTHTKGVMILGGYLNQRYARNHPLSINARLVFEQSYSGVEGDSASSAELYAIISTLSGAPIKQYLAVTGSVNQNGEVQAIGGVNEKIEGFYEVCKNAGLTGRQGCVIPESNVQNLMLKQEVIDAIRAGRFHIFPVKTIDEGIEVLTGKKAGRKLPDGTFEKGTINDIVDVRLAEMAEKVKEYRE